jgi:multidrug efflux pump subunit AcrB
VDFAAGYGAISRVDRSRVITLSAGAAGGTGQAEDRVRKAVKKRLEEAVATGELDLAGGYRIDHAGQAEEEEDNKKFLAKAFIVALLLIIIILVLQFNTFTAPLIIMTTVALSLVGVLAGLMITGMTFSIVLTGIGVISLAGIVVNNAIVLLDCTRQLQRSGMDVVEAAIEAGTIRLRPVLLTATTTIFGLIPMATGVTWDFHTMKLITESESSQFWAPMAIAVIFGLAFATLLTLVVVPTFYVAIFRRVQRLGLGGLEHVDTSEPEAESKTDAA